MITGFRFEATQDVSAMWEADAAAEWERLNADDPDAEKMKDAAVTLDDVYDRIGDAMDSLSDAAKEVDDTGAPYDKVISLLDALNDLQSEVYCLKLNFERGRC